MSDLGTVIRLLLAVAAVCVGLGAHKIPEGHVGVYFRGGALLKDTTGPGFHFMFPLLTSVENVQITVQTDSVTDIPCGTSGGVMIYFDKIEVVNKLQQKYVYDTVKNYTIHYDKTWIFDKIHHEINQFCSAHTLQEVYIDLFDTLDESLAKALQNGVNNWAPGITIIGVRVTKPRIPDSVRRNYEEMEAQRTALLVQQERSKVLEKEAETERKRAGIQAMQAADVSRIEMEKQLHIKQTHAQMQKLEDEMHTARERAFADALAYRIKVEAEAMKAKLTEEYLRYTAMNALANNSKVYFGPSIPHMFSENAAFTAASHTQTAASNAQSASGAAGRAEGANTGVATRSSSGGRREEL